MNPDRERVRQHHDKDLKGQMRLGDWSLEKYEENAGFVIYHWICGYWTHSFFNDNKNNHCAHCLRTPSGKAQMPDDIQALYRLVNFDLMSNSIWNSSIKS